MAKLTISRIFETGKVIQAFAQKGLTVGVNDFVDFVASFAEQTLRALRNGLTFTDNFNCSIKTVSLSSNTPQVISTDGKSPIGMIPIRVVSSSTSLTGFNWYFNNSNQTIVVATFSPTPTSLVDLTLIILF